MLVSFEYSSNISAETFSIGFVKQSWEIPYLRILKQLHLPGCSGHLETGDSVQRHLRPQPRLLGGRPLWQASPQVEQLQVQGDGAMDRHRPEGRLALERHCWALLVVRQS